jgi:glutaredoxin
MSSRRPQAVILALAIILIYILFFSSSGTHTDFRKNTEASLSRRRGILRGDLSDKDLTAKTNRELQSILDRHSAGAGAGAKDRDQKVFEAEPVHGYTSTIHFDGGSSRRHGHTSTGLRKERPKYPANTGTIDSGKDKGRDEEVAYNGHNVETAYDEGENLAREELQSILKKSPSKSTFNSHSIQVGSEVSVRLTCVDVTVIIFSKSYCPYSKRAKHLLLDTYTITPAPYVVELDLLTTPVPKPHHPGSSSDDEHDHPAPTLGKKLQDLLASLTGRKTVPNIMINAQSLGGSDDIAHLEQEGKLEKEILRMGGKRIVSVVRNSKGYED